MKKTSKKQLEYIPYEEEEQRIVVDWLERNNYIFTAIPNSTYTTSWNQKRKNHAMGLRSGLPDLVIILKDYSGILFVEMKRRKGGTVSKEQKRWLEELNKIDNVEAIVAKGADEAINYLTQ